MLDKKEKLKKLGLKILSFFVAFLILAGLVWWAVVVLRTPKPWTGVYYTGVDDTAGIKSPRLKTLEECQSWAHDEAIKHPSYVDSWDYDCGFNCKYTSKNAVNIIDNYECERITK